MIRKKVVIRELYQQFPNNVLLRSKKRKDDIEAYYLMILTLTTKRCLRGNF